MKKKWVRLSRYPPLVENFCYAHFKINAHYLFQCEKQSNFLGTMLKYLVCWFLRRLEELNKYWMCNQTRRWFSFAKILLYVLLMYEYQSICNWNWKLGKKLVLNSPVIKLPTGWSTAGKTSDNFLHIFCPWTGNREKNNPCKQFMAYVEPETAFLSVRVACQGDGFCRKNEPPCQI